MKSIDSIHEITAAMEMIAGRVTTNPVKKLARQRAKRDFLMRKV